MEPRTLNISNPRSVGDGLGKPKGQLKKQPPGLRKGEEIGKRKRIISKEERRKRSASKRKTGVGSLSSNQTLFGEGYGST